jgi:porin
MQNDFAASSSYWGGNLWCTFQSNAICGTPVAAPNNSGYGYYPSSEWGARIRLQTLSKNVYVQTGVYQVNPIYGERYQGFNFSDGGDTGVMIPLETGYQFQNAHGDELGNIKVGAYYDTSDVRTAQADVSTFLPATNDVSAVLPTNTYRGREGGWFLVDHLLEGSSLPNHTGTAIFFSYEYGDPQTALISNFVDGGIVRHGTFAGRSLDTIAVGFDYIDVNPRIRDEETLLQQAGYAVPITNQEKSFELNYGFQVTQAVTLHPNVQYVVNPAGEANVIYTNGFAGIKNAVVLGIDTNITF